MLLYNMLLEAAEILLQQMFYVIFVKLLNFVKLPNL